MTNTTSKPATWYWSCNCTSCDNKVTSSLVKNGTECACNMTGTAANKSCKCSFLVENYCKPPTGPIIDESTCDASMKPKDLNTTANNATNCKYQYEYFVAIVATGSNSSVLM